MIWKSKNKLLFKGKETGHAFNSEISKPGETKAAFKKRALKENAAWNKYAKKKQGNYRTKLVSISSVKAKTKTKKSIFW